MISFKWWLGVCAASVLAAGACGGESSDDNGGAGTGGTVGGSGGTGGSTAGSAGSGGTAGNGGVGASGGTAGTAGVSGCGGGGAADCVDPCSGQFYLPTCVNGAWTCAQGEVCDGGTDASDAAACASGEVPTIEGCMTCAEVSNKLAAEIESARVANAQCNVAQDCTMTASSTTCAGACPIAVAKTGESSFQAALSKLDGDYCKAYVPECGYVTPKCANATLACTAGVCEAVYN